MVSHAVDKKSIDHIVEKKEKSIIFFYLASLFFHVKPNMFIC